MFSSIKLGGEKMYCSKCGLEIGSANFCTECGTAIFSPAQPVPYSPPQRTKTITPAKRIKMWLIAGWVMIAFGTWRFIANIAGLILYGEPSIFDYSIFDNSYAAALQSYRLAIALAVIAIILYLAMIIAGVAIVIVNHKKAKEQQ